MFHKFFNYVIIFLFSIIVITSCNLESNVIESEEESSLISSQEGCFGEFNETDPIQIIDSVLKGVKRERIGHVLRYLAYNVEWIVDGEDEDIPFAGTYNGKREVRRFLFTFNRLVNIQNIIIENNVEDEGNITSYTRFQGKIPSKRKTFDMEYVFTWEFNERNRIEKCYITYNTCSFELALSTRGKSHIVSDTTISPQLQFLYSYFKAVSKPFLASATYEEIRAANVPGVPDWPADAQVDEVIIAGLEGTLVQIPQSTVNDKIIVYFHGGGFIAGFKIKYPMFVYQLAKNTNIPVVSIDYPLAPEDPFPQAPQECYAVYLELLENYDPGNIAIIGESAGGNLVFTTALLAQENNIPLPGALISSSPWLDLTNSGDSIISNEESESMITIEYLTKVGNHYLNGASPLDPIASPLYSNIPEDFPPVYLSASTNEMLLDDSIRMYNKLISEDVDVTIELADDSVHGWPVGVGMAPEADRSNVRIAEFIINRLGTN